jgi:hypothetical protein
VMNAASIRSAKSTRKLRLIPSFQLAAEAIHGLRR